MRLEDFNEEQEHIRSREDRLMERRSARSAQAFSVYLLYWYKGSGMLSLLALLVQKVLRLLAKLNSGQSAGVTFRRLELECCPAENTGSATLRTT